jgi:hypothetical protein
MNGLEELLENLIEEIQALRSDLGEFRHAVEGAHAEVVGQ